MLGTGVEAGTVVEVPGTGAEVVGTADEVVDIVVDLGTDQAPGTGVGCTWGLGCTVVVVRLPGVNGHRWHGIRPFQRCNVQSSSGRWHLRNCKILYGFRTGRSLP